ncbi:MAG TPA: phosphonate ABC transporter, permease protein PhnE [Limnobacter sp.]|uniref:phosphonate ABC transporter, permease protein PhnE n=1 Tax=Limnobacter sp. TaxID=2003368 RepID=UPI002ED9BF1E
MRLKDNPVPVDIPKPMFDARCTSCWVVLSILVLIAASFLSLDLQWRQFFSVDAAGRMLKFIRELLSPNWEPAFVKKVALATLETLAMSALGTLIAAVFGLVWALPASKTRNKSNDQGLYVARGASRAVLNSLRSVPELVWAALMLIALGLGPFAGTMALALHTTGVLGRLFAETIENAPDHAAFALRARGVGPVAVFWYATLPTVLPQLISYTLYRWENNIRAAAILGVVGAGGLGQMLAYHMGLFQMHETSTVLLAMMLLVALVDFLSYWFRVRSSR